MKAMPLWVPIAGFVLSIGLIAFRRFFAYGQIWQLQAIWGVATDQEHLDDYLAQASGFYMTVGVIGICISLFFLAMKLFF